ncbi:MAG TPA: hypothetical protein VIG08_00725 [Gemmatimonadales bacterium]
MAERPAQVEEESWWPARLRVTAPLRVVLPQGGRPLRRPSPAQTVEAVRRDGPRAWQEQPEPGAPARPEERLVEALEVQARLEAGATPSALGRAAARASGARHGDAGA